MTSRGVRPSVTGIFLCLLMGTSGDLARAQDPITLAGNPLRGVIDFHVHSGPDSFTRSVTDFEIARIARDRGMGALVLKNHFTMTADRAVLAERLTGMTCFGGVVLNLALGGLNEEAIKRMVTFSGGRGKVVWLPTFDAENHVKHFQEDRPFVRVMQNGKPVQELPSIFRLIAQHQLVLATGHSSAAECLLLIRAARAAGVTKILVTHAMADPIAMNTAQLKQVAQLGAKIECVWLTNLSGPQSHLPNMRHWRRVTTRDYVAAFREVGTQHFVLASDLGQYLNPIHTDGLTAFILELKQAGLSDEEIDVLCRANAASLLDLVGEVTGDQ